MLFTVTFNVDGFFLKPPLLVYFIFEEYFDKFGEPPLFPLSMLGLGFFPVYSAKSLGRIFLCLPVHFFFFLESFNIFCGTACENSPAVINVIQIWKTTGHSVRFSACWDVSGPAFMSLTLLTVHCKKETLRMTVMQTLCGPACPDMLLKLCLSWHLSHSVFGCLMANGSVFQIWQPSYCSEFSCRDEGGQAEHQSGQEVESGELHHQTHD